MGPQKLQYSLSMKRLNWLLLVFVVLTVFSMIYYTDAIFIAGVAEYGVKFPLSKKVQCAPCLIFARQQ